MKWGLLILGLLVVLVSMPAACGQAAKEQPETIALSNITNTKNTFEVLQQDYISRSVGFSFEELNGTHWLVTYKVDPAFIEDVILYDISTDKNTKAFEMCIDYAASEKNCFNNGQLTDFKKDMDGLDQYPVESLTDIRADVDNINIKSQWGQFHIIFPKGFELDKQFRFGFGSVVVNTTTATYSMAIGSDRKTFYAAGKYWVFYINASDIVYVTSTDGSAWSAEKGVLHDAEIAETEGFGVWHDGTTAWVSASSQTNGDVAFKNITLATETVSEYKKVGVGNGFELYPQIIKTADGYLWLKSESAYPRFYLTKSSNPNSDASWGSTTLVGTDTSKYGHSIIVPLNDTAIMFIYQIGVTIRYEPLSAPMADPDIYEIYRCNYGDWYSIENAENEYLHTMTAVQNGTDSVVFIGMNETQNLKSRWWNGNNWVPTPTTSECAVVYSGTAVYPTATLDENTGNVHVFFYDGSTSIKNTTWSAATGWPDVADDFATGQDSPMYVSSFHSESSNIAVAWQNGSGSPYQIMFNSISLTAEEPVNISFLLQYPDNNYTISTAAGNASAIDLEYNSTDGQDKNVSACVVGNSGHCQTAALGTFIFNNTGDVALKWLTQLNTSLPGSIVVWATLTSTPTAGAIPINETDWAVINASVAVSRNDEAWFWANFTDAITDDATIIKILHDSTEA